MNRILLSSITLCFLISASQAQVPFEEEAWKDLPSNNIEPAGWVKEFLLRQESGLTGHPEESGFPFNSVMWAGNMDYTNRENSGGQDWWPYEQTGFYLDGALRCGNMINSELLKDRVHKNIAYVIAHADNDSIFRAGNIEDDAWALVVFIGMLVEQYEISHDPELLHALEKHYKAVYAKKETYQLAADEGFSIRAILHIEHLCSLYSFTRDKWFLEVAESLYAVLEDLAERSGKYELKRLSGSGMAQGLTPGGHAVTFHLFAKLPAILYYYTGKTAYREAFERAFKEIEQHHELASGLASGTEGMEGKGANMAHELCNVCEYNWAAGWALIASGDGYYADKMEKVLYNAGFSSVKSDFKAHQYYGAPNMPVSSDMSSFYNDDSEWGFTAKARLCYRPGHDTECCTGNVHRMLPTFLNRSCLSGKQGIKVVFYLPGRVKAYVGEDPFSYSIDSNYPFEHKVKIRVEEAPKKRSMLALRIPGWTETYTITINGKHYENHDPVKGFEEIRRKFKKGDMIELELECSPVIDDRGKGMSINYGPLVFSVPFEAKELKTTSDYGSKCSPEFPAYQYIPLNPHNWAYALSAKLQSSDIEIVRCDGGDYPWDPGASPVKLKVKAWQVSNWKLRESVSLTPIPEKVELKTDEADILTLEPMGGTLLRLTEFAKTDMEAIRDAADAAPAFR